VLQAKVIYSREEKKSSKMSLVPRFYTIDPVDFNHFGSRQHRQPTVEELLATTGFHRAWDHVPHDQNLLEEKHSAANVTQFNDGKIQICIDVHHFGQNDITVKTLRNTIIIEGRHEELVDEFGSVERHFVRKYPLPKANQTSDVQSTLSSDGVLTVTVLAPAKVVKEDEDHRVVPIHRTGAIHLTLHNFHETAPEKPIWK
jgi:HSP20 family molecular chaperone IbpA